MSEPKRISPLLDDFAVGDAIFQHHGVRCHPAIRESSDEQYMVKVVTVPAAQAQFDAFLLTGAYKDPADAMQYFEGVANSVGQEADFLKDLSKLSGFLPYEGWQIAEITRHRLGYEVYLLGCYRQSLEKLLRTQPMTHSDALQLALDVCSALNVCRQAGALYVDLKPGNLFRTDSGEYCIGDLGFLKQDALSYSALPEKYQSRYTPPELLDPMAPVDFTVDTYALGMILYQLYNEGVFPEKQGSDPLPAPAHADYELAEIILKAIDPQPENRWTDPVRMAQAILAYMERNPPEAVPITPYIPIDAEAQDVLLPRDGDTQEASATPSEPAEAPSPEEEPSREEASDPEKAEVDSLGKPPLAEETATEEAPVKAAEPEAPAEPVKSGDADELSRIIAKADDLIAHETPVGVIVPEIPQEPDPFAFAAEDSIEAAERNTPLDPIMADPGETTAGSKTKQGKFRSMEARKKTLRFLGNTAAVALLAGVCWAGFWGYQNIYLQTIDELRISGTVDQIVVEVQSRIPESKLHVTCTNGLGITQRAELVNGQATFSDLQSNTSYDIRLEIDGFHALVGQTSDVFTTQATTVLKNLTAVTGPEDGSVVVSFDVEGDEPRNWMVVYGIPGEGFQSKTFEGHTVTIKDLNVGKHYAFTVESGDRPVCTISGEQTVTALASRLILAEDFTVSSSGDHTLLLSWRVPGDAVVEKWDVRCIGRDGSEQNLTVTESQITLENMDSSQSYTVEVTADGMTQPAVFQMTPNPITISSLQADASNGKTIEVSWTYSGSEPEGGWLLLYGIDGNPTQNLIRCETAAASISPCLPGVDYSFTLMAADETTVLNAVQSFACPEAGDYAANQLTPADIIPHTLKTPEDPQWRYETVGADAFTDSFAVGDSISLVLKCGKDFYQPGTDVEVLYLIEDSFGNVLPDVSAVQRINWRKIWQGGDVHYGELTLPSVPRYAGTYQLRIYIDGAFLTRTEFTIS